jgi:hypothetical protein
LEDRSYRIVIQSDFEGRGGNHDVCSFVETGVLGTRPLDQHHLIRIEGVVEAAAKIPGLTVIYPGLIVGELHVTKVGK